MLAQLSPDSGDSVAPPVLIFAVTGMGGIGKTALAVEAAHRACAQGWFPGGTLFVDLRGYDDNPVTADQAVLALLDAMGVQGADLPQATERQYDSYRKLLSERQNRTLLILDNASDPSQFLPLLPGTDQHRVLITSRERPDALPVRLIDLETLAPDDSAALVTHALHAADERDDRPAREPEALRELTELCGHLPLALQIAAAMLRRRRGRDIGLLVAEIRRVGDALAVLDNGSRGTDQYGRSLALRPVVETSYRRLPPDQARLLRLLALAPGAETGAEAVAALTDLDMDTAMELLEDLAAAGLVTPVPTGGDVRWRLHDLVRAFGVDAVAADAGLREEGERARERLLDFYLRWADAADERLQWLPALPEPERFTTRAEAFEWLDAERAGLVAAVQWATEDPFAEAAARLARRLAVYLHWRRHFDDWLTVARAAQQASSRTGGLWSEACAWSDLGIALTEAGRAEEAIDAHLHARRLFQAAGDHHGEGATWGYLGYALQEAGRWEQAVEAHTRACDALQTAGDHHDQATAWSNLGYALAETGRAKEAVKALTRARDLYQSAGDPHGEAIALGNLGYAVGKAGQAREAIELYSKSLAIFREFDDWHTAGQVLQRLADAHEATNDLPQARTAYLQAAEAFTRANAPTEAANAQSAAHALT